MKVLITHALKIVWPRTLFGRLTLILFIGLLVAHALSFWLVAYERANAVRSMMVYNLSKDLATSVAIIERLPPEERGNWLAKLERKNYRYVLGPAPAGQSFQNSLTDEIISSLSRTLGMDYPINITLPPNGLRQLQLHLQLSDGTPLTIELSPSQPSISHSVPLVLGMQLFLLACITLFAVRWVTRPLAQLAKAADSLGPELKTEPLSETGPMEVARAATAFNAMQRRIAAHLAERIQILAAISHDLQTPITRMRLRADLMNESEQRDKMQNDLAAMQTLVEEGLAYARSVHLTSEAACRTDLNALLSSIVCDYEDAGQDLKLSGQYPVPVMTRPRALKRVITNLIDNALKFGKDVEIVINNESPAGVLITVLDRGPGIEPEELDAVRQPFYRLEGSRNRDTGGTGLGLAIAHQITLSLGGELKLFNRDGGGLGAEVELPVIG